MAATVIGAVLVLGACGGGGGDAPEGASAEAYCKLSAQFSAAADPPTEAQLAEIVRVAPTEIRDHLRLLVRELRSGTLTEEVAAAAAAVTAFEKANCGGGPAAGP